MALLATLAAALVGASATAGVPVATGPSTDLQEGAARTLRLSHAPVELRVGGDPAWGLRLATYADAAAEALEEMLGRTPAPGTIRWSPGASAEPSSRLGFSAPAGHGGGREIVITDSFDRMARDFGLGLAGGYGRWLMGYAMAHLTLPADSELPGWVRDGAALYLTDLLSRRERATTPALYSLSSAYTRAARQPAGVTLGGELGELDDETRGKAYATFRLLEYVYGRDVVIAAVGALAAGAPGLEQALERAGGPGLRPAASEVLDPWLEPRSLVDVGIDRVDVRDGGRTVEVRVRRSGNIPLPAEIVVRCAEGQTVRESLPATTRDEVEVELSLPSPPVEVRVDPERLLPDANVANNVHGFGNAARIREFFALDRVIRVGDLQLEGELRLQDGQRAEDFTLSLANLTEEPVGLGILLSASWQNRPERMQRAIFVNLGPEDRRLISDHLVYPGRGSGRARVEARFWRAADVDDFRSRTLKVEPDLRDAYLLVREDPPSVPGGRTFGVPWNRIDRVDEPQQSVEAPASAGDEATERDPGAREPDIEIGATPDDTPGPRLRFVSPARGAPPVGELEVEIAAEAGEAPIERVELYVNDRRVAAFDRPPYRLAHDFSESEQVFALRAVALDADGRIATATRILDRGGLAFGVSVNLVTLHVTVRAPGGVLADALTAADFTVLEDGVEQEIVQFDHGEIPVSVGLLLDTSSSMIGGGIAAARAGATRLVDRLVGGSDADRAMILGFNDRLYTYSAFTGDASVLETAIDNTVPDGPTALFDSLAAALRKVNVARGKRALVVLSDGLDTRSSFSYRDVLEYARQADVLVYTIGLQLMHEGTELGDASDAVRRGVEQLRGLAESTGGAAYFPLRLDELQDIYAAIAEELASQYSLSYYPTDTTWDGEWRQVEVRLSGRPAFRIQVRPGYYAVEPAGPRRD